MHKFNLNITSGAPGCIDLKREFPDFEIGRKPTKSSDGKTNNWLRSF